MQIPILNGVFTDTAADFRVSYPVNLVPVVVGDKGLGAGYLRPAEGLVLEGTGPGPSRGGINWRDTVYRVMGSQLVSVSAAGVVTALADVGAGGNVTFDYSFDRLAVTAGLRLYYVQQGTLPANEANVPPPAAGAHLIAVGSNGTIITSPDGITWTTRTSGTTEPLLAVIWNGALFVVTGNNGGIFTSPDGITWTARTSGTGAALGSIVWTGTQFAVAARSGNGTILTSPDGITWTARSNGTNTMMQAIAWNGALLVAGGDSGRIFTSPDGIIWTQRHVGAADAFNGAVWSGTQFVFTGFDGAGGLVFTSPDGITWTIRAGLTTQQLAGVAWNGLQFVTVASVGGILTSPDAITWTPRTSGTTIGLSGIAWSGTQFVVTGGDVATGLVLTSPDGIVWTTRTSGVPHALRGVAWAGPKTGGIATSEVTDPNLRPAGSVGPIDLVWIDGYFAVTDGQHVIVTELADPTRINPLRYGSSEVDPDPIVAVEKLRGELHVINRHTIEVFRNVGARFFPFQRVEGAMMPRGALGTHCVCVFGDTLAMLGSGRNESPSIWLAANGQTTRIGTRETDTLLRQYTETQLSTAVLEARIDRNHQHLWLRLPDRTLVYDAVASQNAQQPIWFVLTSALADFAAYRARDLVWCYNRWLVGDSVDGRTGRLDDTVSTQYGNHARWEFGTLVMYNQGRGAIVHELELVALTGRVAVGIDPIVNTSYSLDGVTWVPDRGVRAGMQGDRLRRLVWLQQGFLRSWRVQRFRGDSRAFATFARLQAKVEALEV